jgi:hypothetical protein
MLGTVLDTGGSVGILPLGVLLPAVLDRVVTLHRRTLLFADAVVVEVAASLEVGVDSETGCYRRSA